MRKLLAYAASFAVLALVVAAPGAFAAAQPAIDSISVSPSSPLPKIARGKSQTFTIGVVGRSIPSSNPVRLFIDRDGLGSNIASMRFASNNDQSINVVFSGAAQETKSVQVIVDVLGSASFEDHYFSINAFLSSYYISHDCSEGASCTPQQTATVAFIVPSPSGGTTPVNTELSLYPSSGMAGVNASASFSIQLPLRPTSLDSRCVRYYEESSPEYPYLNQEYCDARINPFETILGTPSGSVVTKNEHSFSVSPSKEGTYTLQVPVQILSYNNAKENPKQAPLLYGNKMLTAILTVVPNVSISPSPSTVYAAHSVSFKLMNGSSDATSQAQWSAQNPSVAQPGDAGKNVFYAAYSNATSDKQTTITASLNGVAANSSLTVKPMYYFVSATPSAGNDRGMLYTFRTLDGATITKVESDAAGNSKLNIVLQQGSTTLYDNNSPQNLLREYTIRVTPKDNSVAGSFPIRVYFIPKK